MAEAEEAAVEDGDDAEDEEDDEEVSDLGQQARIGLVSRAEEVLSRADDSTILVGVI